MPDIDFKDDYFFKVIRADGSNFWPQFLEGLLGKKTPLRKPGGRYKYTIRLNEEQKEYEIVSNANKIPRLPSQTKRNVTKPQSLSYASPSRQYHPHHAGVSGEYDVGVSFRKVVVTQRVMVYDGPTFSRPYDFDTEKEAQQYLQKRLDGKVWHPNLNSLVAAGKTQPHHINEVMARVNIDNLNAIVIFTDNIPSRLLAQIRRNDFKRLTDWEIPIRFYPQERLYTAEEQKEDREGNPGDQHAIFLQHEEKNFFGISIKAWCELGPMLGYLSEATRHAAYDAILEKDIENYFLKISNNKDYCNFIKTLPTDKKVHYLKTKHHHHPLSSDKIDYEDAIFFIRLLYSLRKENLLTDAEISFYFNEDFKKLIPQIIGAKPSEGITTDIWLFIMQYAPAYINCLDRNGLTLLISAAYYHRLDVVVEAIRLGANPAIKVATQNGNMDVMKIALARNAIPIVSYLCHARPDLFLQYLEFDMFIKCIRWELHNSPDIYLKHLKAYEISFRRASYDDFMQLTQLLWEGHKKKLLTGEVIEKYFSNYNLLDFIEIVANDTIKLAEILERWPQIDFKSINLKDLPPPIKRCFFSFSLKKNCLNEFLASCSLEEQASYLMELTQDQIDNSTSNMSANQFLHLMWIICHLNKKGLLSNLCFIYYFSTNGFKSGMAKLLQEPVGGLQLLSCGSNYLPVAKLLHDLFKKHWLTQDQLKTSCFFSSFGAEFLCQHNNIGCEYHVELCSFFANTDDAATKKVAQRRIETEIFFNDRKSSDPKSATQLRCFLFAVSNIIANDAGACQQAINQHVATTKFRHRHWLVRGTLDVGILLLCLTVIFAWGRYQYTKNKKIPFFYSNQPTKTQKACQDFVQPLLSR